MLAAAGVKVITIVSADTGDCNWLNTVVGVESVYCGGRAKISPLVVLVRSKLTCFTPLMMNDTRMIVGGSAELTATVRVIGVADASDFVEYPELDDPSRAAPASAGITDSALFSVTALSIFFWQDTAKEN